METAECPGQWLQCTSCRIVHSNFQGSRFSHCGAVIEGRRIVRESMSAGVRPTLHCKLWETKNYHYHCWPESNALPIHIFDLVLLDTLFRTSAIAFLNLGPILTFTLVGYSTLYIKPAKKNISSREYLYALWRAQRSPSTLMSLAHLPTWHIIYYE